MDISFPKKSYFSQNEAQIILGLDSVGLRQKIKEGLKALSSECGKKLFLREDIVKLYAQMDVATEKNEFAVDKDHSQLVKFRNQFSSALELISQIKQSHSEIWRTH